MRGKLIILLLLSLFILGGCTDKNVSNVITPLKSNKIATAATSYNQEINNKKLSQKEKGKVQTQVNSYANTSISSLLSGYKNNKIDYKTIQNDLKAYSKFKDSNVNKLVTTTSKKVQEIKKNRDYYTKATDYFNNKDYVNAIENYRLIEKSSSLYKDAQTKINKSLSLAMQGIQTAYNNKDYKSKIDEITQLDLYFSENKDYTTLSDKYKQKYVNSQIKITDIMVKKHDYTDAVNTLQNISDKIYNKKLQGKISSYQKEQKVYINKIKSQLTAKTTHKYDSINDWTVYVPKGYDPQHVNVFYNKVSFYPMITVTKDGSMKFFDMYAGFGRSNWIFFDSIEFNVDGDRFTWSTPPLSNSKQTQIGYNGDVYEWGIIRSLTNTDLIKQLNEIANSKSAKIRFQGNGFEDYTLTSHDKATLKVFLQLYNIL